MAESKKTGTVYQQLNRMLNLDGFGFHEPQKENTSKILIKGNSPQEIHMKGLELEQKQKLQDKFFRTTDRGFQKALQYEAARLPAYIDYEGMEYYPIISSALDLFMEETTTIGFDGQMLKVFSNKERIKFLLEEFFYDIVNVNVNLPFWTRNLVKYGDNFVLLYGEKKKGVTNVKQMVNYEIERLERVQSGKPVVKFKERMTGDEFNVFEVAHFRLLGDDKYLPYGSSILNKVRRVFRQLIMAEDAMLTYRIIRAGEKKVFKIDVGNMDEDDIENYVYKVATKFKKIGQTNPNDGQIDYRFNMLGNDEDYFLPVRNPNTQTGIETLPGASNLNQIQDIEYLRDNLFTGLGVPKPFLSFQDAVAGGKNMAQYDIRFAKKINRIQQALIQELNKMAMIHLHLMGFAKEDLTDFRLLLNNPSTQEETLRSELLREKAQTYAELTRGEGGIAAMSHTRAKRQLFNMSDREIVEDLKQQKMEKAVMQELQDAPVIIKQTGIFKDIDTKYGEPREGDFIPPEGEEGEETPEGPGGTPPGGEGAEDLPFQSPADLPPIEGEGFTRDGKLKLTENAYNEMLEKLVYGTSFDSKKFQSKTIQKALLKENQYRNDMLNVSAENMVKEIDKMLENKETINIQRIEIEENIEDVPTFDDVMEINLDNH